MQCVQIVVSYAAFLRMLSKHSECEPQLTEEEADTQRELDRGSRTI